MKRWSLVLHDFSMKFRTRAYRSEGLTVLIYVLIVTLKRFAADDTDNDSNFHQQGY